MYKPVSFLALSLLAGNSLSAQQMYDVAALRKKYPNEKVVMTEQKEEVTIKKSKKGLTFTTRNTASMLFLTQEAPQYSERTISFKESIQKISDIKAVTLLPETDGYKTIKADPPKEIHPYGGDIFFEDVKEKQIQFKSLKEGAIAQLSYTEELNDPHYFGGFYFHSGLPVEHAHYSIDCPEGVKLRFRLMGNDTSRIRFSKTTKGSITHYEWEAKEIPPLDGESDAPNPRYYLTHLIVYVESYDQKGETKEVFSTPARLHSWYNELVKDAVAADDPEPKRIADSLTRSVTSDYEKTRRIFYWVQDHIRYVAFEDGLGGLVPRTAEAVCSKRFGDCKDMANLLVSMLTHSGVKAYRVWIGTRDIPYKYVDVPTGSSDNHMIAMAEVDGKSIFLDATGRMPMGFPTPMIQGKEGLVSRSADKFDIMVVPEIARQKNHSSDTMKVWLEGSTIKGKVESVSLGMRKFYAESQLMYLSPSEREKHLQVRYRMGNNKSKCENIVLSGFKDRDSALSAKYDITIPNHVVEHDNELYVNLLLRRNMDDTPIDTAVKKLDREFDIKYQNSCQVTLEVPKGYKVTKLPPNARFSHPKFGFQVEYRQTGNSVTMICTNYQDMLMLKRSEFAEWNNMVKAAIDAYRQTVVLQKI